MLKRDVVFRGKSKSTGEWVFGNLFDEDTKGRTHIGTTVRMCFDIDPETVGQYTGLTDKNGREIYEGDIVSAFSNINKISDPHLSTSDPTYSNKYVEFIRGVFSLSSLEFPNGGCGVLDHYVGAMSQDLEIIGNIHDNKELLK